MGATLPYQRKATASGAGVPPGAPRWVTAELIQETIEVWQPHSPERLTEQDALDILLNVTQLFDLLGGK